MKRKCALVSCLSFLAFSNCPAVVSAEEGPRKSSESKVSNSTVEAILKDWPNRPVLGARQMILKYGLPQEASIERLMWNDQGPFKRIEVTRVETPHDFPKPHMDYMEHTIEYRVPKGKSDAILDFDGSVTVDRTAGELSAKCDLEGHNILTLNITNDVATGKKNVEEARQAFGKNVEEDVKGNNPPYVTALQFEPSSAAHAFPDTPVISGSPVRATGGSSEQDRGMLKRDSEGLDDAEILGFIAAVDDNEILAAAEASKKKLSPAVLTYAKMLQTEHAKNLMDTMKLGKEISATPLDTAAVDAVRVKGAGELAALVPLEGDEFGSAYVKAMIKGHTEALEMIDNRLLPAAANEAVKKHLSETRGHVAAHLKAAQDLAES